MDFWLLGAVVILALCGLGILPYASSSTADAIGLGSFHFFYKQLLFLPVAATLLVAASMLSTKGILRVAVLVAVLSMAGTLATLIASEPIKGATRWLHIGGVGIQPVEFFKPALAVLAAYLMATQPYGKAASLALALSIAAMCLLQPDLGQAFIVMAIWSGQFFIAGASNWFLLGALGVVALAGIGAYYGFSHFRMRLDAFLEGDGGYQVSKSLEAFASGGILGRGPGEGIIKNQLPDSHSDFIFAVIAEEFGLMACLLLLAVVLFIALKPMVSISATRNGFLLLATVGLVINFALQAFINLTSTVALLPPKGIGMPFVSYGGSSLMALALNIGLLLALLRAKQTEPKWSG